MNEVDSLLAQDKQFQIIAVRFPFDYSPVNNCYYNSRKYHYKTILDVEEGDTVIVCVNGLYKSVLVVDTHIKASRCQNIKWVVQKVCDKQYEKCIKVEKELLQHVRKNSLSSLVKKLIKELRRS